MSELASDRATSDSDPCEMHIDVTLEVFVSKINIKTFKKIEIDAILWAILFIFLHD